MDSPLPESPEGSRGNRHWRSVGHDRRQFEARTKVGAAAADGVVLPVGTGAISLAAKVCRGRCRSADALAYGLAANRLQPEERRHGRLRVEVEGSVRVIATPAKLSGDVCGWLAREAKSAVLAGQTMVVDMSVTVRVEADGLGGLLEARRILLTEGLWIWLAGMSNPVRRVLQFSAMSDLFRIATTPEEAIRFTVAAQAAAPHVKEAMAAMGVRGRSVTNSSIARAS